MRTLVIIGTIWLGLALAADSAAPNPRLAPGAWQPVEPIAHNPGPVPATKWGDVPLPAGHPYGKMHLTQQEADALFEIFVEGSTRQNALDWQYWTDQISEGLHMVHSANLEHEMEQSAIQAIGADRMDEFNHLTAQWVRDLTPAGWQPTPVPPCAPDCHVFPVPDSGADDHAHADRPALVHP